MSTFMKKLPDKEVEVEVENQPDVEVTEEAAAVDTVGSSQMSSSSSSAGCSGTSSYQCNGMIDRDEDWCYLKLTIAQTPFYAAP